MRKSVSIILLCCSIVVQCSAGFDITECYKNCDKQESACVEYVSSKLSAYCVICKDQYDDCKLPLPKVSTATWQTGTFNMTALLLECIKIYSSCIKGVLDQEAPIFNNCSGRHIECSGKCNDRMKDENENTREMRKTWVELAKVGTENTIMALMFTKVGGWIVGLGTWLGTTRLGRWVQGQQAVQQQQ